MRYSCEMRPLGGSLRSGRASVTVIYLALWSYCRCLSFHGFAIWIFSEPASRGTSKDEGGRTGPFQSGIWMVTFAAPLPASPGTRTEPPISAPHHRSLRVIFLSMGRPSRVFGGYKIWATGSTCGRTMPAKEPGFKPGVPTRTCRASDRMSSP